MPNFIYLISKLDIFGQPINLNLDKNSKYKSVLGGLVSIVIVLLLVGYTINEIIGYTVSRNVQITQETRFIYNPDLLRLDNQNFIFAVKIEQDDFVTNPLFDIKLYHQTNNQIVQIQLQQCDFQQFVQVFNQDLSQLLQAYQIDQWLCPKQEFEIQLEGTAFSDIYMNAFFEIQNCENYSSWGSVCQKRDENSITTYKLQMFTKNTVFCQIIFQFINPFKNDFVAEDYLDNSMSIYFQTGQLQGVDYLFQKHITIDFSGQIKIQGVFDEYSETIMNSNTHNQIYLGQNDQTFIKIRFLRSNLSTTYNRQYQTVTDLLSKIGGLSSSVISIVGILIRYYNKAQFYSDLSNRLYDFDFHDENQSSTKESRFLDNQQAMITQSRKKRKNKNNQNVDDEEIKEHKEHKSDPEDSLEQNPKLKEKVEEVIKEQQQVLKDYTFKNKKHFILTSFQQFISKKEILTLNLKYFLYTIMCKRKAQKSEKQLYLLQKSIEFVQQELDVFAILSRIHQLEKLKQILFDYDQLILFNYSPKPVISLNDVADDNHFLIYSKTRSQGNQTIFQIAETIKNQLKYQFQTKNNLNIENIYNSYKTVTEKNRKSTRFYYKINNKLKDFLGDQLKAIFKASKLIQFDEQRFEIEKKLNEIESIPVESRAAKLPLRKIDIHMEDEL